LKLKFKFLEKYKKLFLYMGRWQMSSPILAISVIFIPGSTTVKVILANIIGSLVFFPVDKWIMSRKEPVG
jgi:hypothetical protein